MKTNNNHINDCTYIAYIHYWTPTGHVYLLHLGSCTFPHHVIPSQETTYSWPATPVFFFLQKVFCRRRTRSAVQFKFSLNVCIHRNKTKDLSAPEIKYAEGKSDEQKYLSLSFLPKILQVSHVFLLTPPKRLRDEREAGNENTVINQLVLSIRAFIQKASISHLTERVWIDSNTKIGSQRATPPKKIPLYSISCL